LFGLSGSILYRLDLEVEATYVVYTTLPGRAVLSPHVGGGMIP
jgi:hypothetical protein